MFIITHLENTGNTKKNGKHTNPSTYLSLLLFNNYLSSICWVPGTAWCWTDPRRQGGKVLAFSELTMLSD